MERRDGARKRVRNRVKVRYQAGNLRVYGRLLDIGADGAFVALPPQVTHPGRLAQLSFAHPDGSVVNVHSVPALVMHVSEEGAGFKLLKGS